MSVSLITSADIDNHTRIGTLVDCVDTGGDMGVNLSGTFLLQLFGTPCVAGTFIVTILTTPDSFSGCTGTYSIGGDVDWDHLIVEIPSIALISKIVITAQADYSLSSNAATSADSPLAAMTATAGAQIFMSLDIPDMLNSAPTSQTNISDFEQNHNSSAIQSPSESASVSNPGVILRKEWNFAADLGNYPLGYIEYDDLVAWFTRQRILLSATEIYSAIKCDTVLSGSPTADTDVNGSLLITSVNWLMEVTFEVAYQWELENNSPVQAGDRVRLTSPLVDGIDWTQVTGVTLDWIDSGGTPHSITVPPLLWITITITLFVFELPPLTDEPQIFEINITSTQFSGEVTLGKLATIFLINATGIYTLVPGKTNDTLYDNDNGGDPVDVAIPNPFFKTGYIGG